MTVTRMFVSLARASDQLLQFPFPFFPLHFVWVIGWGGPSSSPAVTPLTIALSELFLLLCGRVAGWHKMCLYCNRAQRACARACVSVCVCAHVCMYVYSDLNLEIS